MTEPLDGLTVTLDTGTVTVTCAEADAVPDVAVIVAVPFSTAVTNPDGETVATDGFDEAHVTVAPAIAAPPPSLTVAVSCCVAPIDESVTVGGATVRDTATCCTVIAELAAADPEVAVTVAVPLATAVTNPDGETVAAA